MNLKNLLKLIVISIGTLSLPLASFGGQETHGSGGKPAGTAISQFRRVQQLLPETLGRVNQDYQLVVYNSNELNTVTEEPINFGIIFDEDGSLVVESVPFLNGQVISDVATIYVSTFSKRILIHSDVWVALNEHEQLAIGFLAGVLAYNDTPHFCVVYQELMEQTTADPYPACVVRNSAQ